jgi:hypothetical protein
MKTGLWRINLHPDKPWTTIAAANNFYESRSSGALVNYLYKAMFSPTKSAPLQAAKKGHLTTWSGLTEEAINGHLKMTPATSMVHMNQRHHKNLSTTKNKITSDLEDEIITSAVLGPKTHLLYAAVMDQGQLYTNLKVRFPVRSRKENWYVMVCYSHDCNYVKPVLMSSISASAWLKAYGGIHQELTSKGFTPKLQTLDKEASAALKSYFTENIVEYQLVPPHCHRHNATECPIPTFKEHFVAGLALADPNFPLHMWDHLLPQAEMTLNLLRTSRQHLKLSAAAHFHGMIDYNKTECALPKCKIVAHETTFTKKNFGTSRTTWILIRSCNASIQMPKCSHFFNG